MREALECLRLAAIIVIDCLFRHALTLSRRIDGHATNCRCKTAAILA
jgi:hypothetical protein